MAVGSFWHKYSERLENNTWIGIQNPPIDSDEMFSYAVIFYAGHHYYFGGYYNEGGSKSILALEEKTWTWSNFGKMNSGRIGHGVTMVRDVFMVIGGSDDKRNEACLLKNGKFKCTKFATSLKDYDS